MFHVPSWKETPREIQNYLHSIWIFTLNCPRTAVLHSNTGRQEIPNKPLATEPWTKIFQPFKPTRQACTLESRIIGGFGIIGGGWGVGGGGGGWGGGGGGVDIVITINNRGVGIIGRVGQGWKNSVGSFVVLMC